MHWEVFYTDQDVRWFNLFGDIPNWSSAYEKCIACLIRGQGSPELSLCLVQGTEMGLSIAKAITQAHGGRISVENPSWAKAEELGRWSPGVVVSVRHRLVSRGRDISGEQIHVHSISSFRTSE